MHHPDAPRTDRLLRSALWFYVAPRAIVSVLVLGTFGLAAFLVLLSLTLNVLHRLGG